MKNPLVAVIIPVYNGERYLAEAIQSVQAQTYSPIELIVVDDGSTDGSAEIARSTPGVVYIHQENKGLPSARNTGILAAKGEYIAFLDADDLWKPQKLSKQVAYHQDNPNISFSFTMERFFYEDPSNTPNWAKKKVFQGDHVAYCPGSSLIRKEVFKKVGLYDPEYRSGDGTEFTFRAKDAGVEIGVVHEVLLSRRIHQDNLSHNVQGEITNLLKSVKASIDRQHKRTRNHE